MASLNKIMLLGNLTNNPDVRTIPNEKNTAVCRVGMAVNRKYKDKEEVMYIGLVSYGRLAEIFGEYLQKGSMVCVSGRLKQESWEKDGVKHSRHVVIVEDLQMVGGKYGEKVSTEASEAVKDKEKV